MHQQSHHTQRTVFAPQSSGSFPSPLPAAPIVSVQLNENEDVQWTWTTLPNGQQYVSGYTIIKSAV